jgi:hypothetical protein
MCIGLINPTFVGYGQQDSHELLQALLDGLHEDLNRIAIKKYIEDPEIGELSHNEFAKRSWEYYLKRNNSIIVDLFQAQLKNRTECQVCFHESIKFDPYMYLQLPIPEIQEVLQPIIALGRVDGIVYSKPIRFSMKLKRNASILDLKLATAKFFSWSEEAQRDPTYTVVVEFWKMNIHKTFRDYETIGGFLAGDIICVVELENVSTIFRSLGDFEAELPKDLQMVTVEFRVTTERSRPFAPPLVVLFPPVISLHTPTLQTRFAYNSGILMYRVLIRELTRYSLYPLYRRVGSGISSLVPPFVDSSIDPNTNWTDEGSNEWEPIPNLFKLTNPNGFTWYPLEDPVGPEILPIEQLEVDGKFETLKPEDSDETSTGPLIYTPANDYLRPMHPTYHPRVISEHRFGIKLAMEFDDELAQKLFGDNIKNSGQADSLDRTVFQVWT